MELFQEARDSAGFKAGHPANPLSTQIWKYEKAILIILAILVTGIIAFSLGVEKGRQLTPLAQSTAVQRVKPLETTALAQTIIKKEVMLKQAPVAIQQQGVFTIQVASFKTKANAQKEAEMLKQKGLTTLFLARGGYTILCVGNFPNKETAQPLLSELNKHYGSCYLRRL